MNEMKRKAKFFFENKITIHIDTSNRRFYNGLIIEFHEDFILVNDRILGETPIYFSEISFIERFRE